MLAISLPSVVGLAGWPWVRDSIGRSASAWANSRNRAITASSAGSSTRSRPSASISACEVLLMSSEVQPKWMNSDTFITSALWPRRFLSQYSMALTSWLVVASIAFTASPSSVENCATTASSSTTVAGENGAISASAGSAASAFSHSTSTRTRLRIRPCSEKCSRRPATLPW